ncbi:MAG TPA: PepSY domain-containing protein [Ureibacillus sp.]|nr:PepSY domain-containing protein [Ureibacillus sp.]
MKKVILVPALVGIMGIGGIIAVAGEDLISFAESSKLLTKSEIKTKALAEVNGTITEIEYEHERNKSYYEVEVMTNDAEYDLVLDAITGEILSKRKELIGHNIGARDNQSTQVSTVSSNQVKNQSTTQSSTIQNATTPVNARTEVEWDDRYDDDDYENDLDDRYDDDRYDD